MLKSRITYYNDETKRKSFAKAFLVALSLMTFAVVVLLFRSGLHLSLIQAYQKRNASLSGKWVTKLCENHHAIRLKVRKSEELEDSSSDYYQVDLFPKLSNDGCDFDARVTYNSTTTKSGIQTAFEYSFITSPAGDMFSSYKVFQRDAVVPKSQCTSAELTRPLIELRASLFNSEAVDPILVEEALVGKMRGRTCDEGSWMQMHWEDQTFIFCVPTLLSSFDNTGPKTVISKDMHVEIQYFKTTDGSQTPNIEPTTEAQRNEIMKNCRPIRRSLSSINNVARSWSENSTQVTIVVEDAINNSGRHRKLLFERLFTVFTKLNLGRIFQHKSKCKCGIKPRKCLFVHGVGERYDMKRQLAYTTSMPDYWGSNYLTKKNLPCCSSITYARMDTLRYGWEDSEVQKQFCAAAAAIGNTSMEGGAPSGLTSSNVTKTLPVVVEDLIVVSHSMGNLIVAASLSNNHCSFGKSVKWASVQGPWVGAKAVDKVEAKCRGKSNTVLEDIAVSPMLQFLGYCPLSKGHLSLSRREFKRRRSAEAAGKKTSDHHSTIAEVHAVYRKHVSAVLCGTSSLGLFTGFSFVTQAASVINGFVGATSDGFVQLSSCSTGNEALFSNNYKNKYYSARVSHVDGTFRNGDGWWGKDRKPLRWLQCLCLS